MTIRTTTGRGTLYDSVLDTVGNTPCIRINRIAPDNVTVYVKV
jgi:cysteine synthase